MRHHCAAFLAVVGALVVAAPAGGYRFLSIHDDDRSTPAIRRSRILPSEEAPKWSTADFPLRYQLLENEWSRQDNFTWREIRDALEAMLPDWNNIPTSRAEVFLAAEPGPGAGNVAGDGRNTVAFHDEHFGRASWVFDREGRIVECDILLPGRKLRLDEEFPGYTAFIPSNSFQHEVGHCLGLKHTEPHPMPTAQRHGALASLLPGFTGDPNMSYGPEWIGLTADEHVAVSLLYPAAGFRESHGAVAGTVRLSDGGPVIYGFVRAVERTENGEFRAGPGVFTDEDGSFLLEGLKPGVVMLWVHPLVYRTQFCHPHLFPDAHASGSLDFADQWQWVEVEAGGTTSLPGAIRVQGEERPRVMERTEAGE